MGGKAAIELIKAAGQYGDPEALSSLMYTIENDLIRRNPYSNGGKSYFDSVPENDRIEFFVSMMDAVLAMPGFRRRDAATRGLQIVDRVLPDGMIAPAKDALWKVDGGNNVDFRSEVHRWQA